jgi:two-component system response regulator HydG
VPVVLPPLRQRRGDIAALADYFLRRHCQWRGKSVTGFSAEAMELLMKHDWPGNVRELENVVERAVVLTESAQIIAADLLYYARGSQGRSPAASDVGTVPSDLTLSEMERLHIQRVLREEGGNRARAARRLGIDRKTLWRRLRRYGQNAPSGRG